MDKQYYKELDISLTGKPVGIEKIPTISPRGICYCIVTANSIVQRVDVYDNAKRIHYKEFGYDEKGRVIENKMYSADGHGGWQIVDDIWHYEYDKETGLRCKKIMQLPGASTAREILYDQNGQKVQETTIRTTSSDH